MMLLIESDNEVLTYPVFVEGLAPAVPLDRTIHVGKSLKVHGQLALSNIHDHQHLLAAEELDEAVDGCCYDKKQKRRR
jgi:hypothetical protein